MLTGFILWVMPEHRDFAWAVFLVMLAPTATAAPAVVRMRGGDPGLVIGGVLLQHLLVAFLVPFWVWALHDWMPISASLAGGWDLPIRILLQVLPLVVIPFALAKLLRWLWPKGANTIAQKQPLSLFLWAIAVFFVVAKARAGVGALLDLSGTYTGVRLIVSIAMASLVLCICQFYYGRRLSPQGLGEAGAQVLGQKNTILAIWIGGTWFGPWASLGPLFYILWQNLYIAWVTGHSIESKS